jgi:hypothetical protein
LRVNRAHGLRWGRSGRLSGVARRPDAAALAVGSEILWDIAV